MTIASNADILTCISTICITIEDNMSSLTIRLPDKVLSEIDQRAQELNLSRTAYIKKSIEHMNKEIKENERKKRLIEVSKRVRKESMLVNSEFSQIEYDPEN